MSAASPANTYEHPHHPPPAAAKSSAQMNQNNDQDRTKFILDIFLQSFSDSMRANAKGWRGRFRKMAADEFAFYRGSAVLFYRDLHNTLSQDRWIKNCAKASNIFIHVSIQLVTSISVFIHSGRSSCRKFRYIYRSIRYY